MSSVEHETGCEGMLDSGAVDVLINDARVVGVPIVEIDESLVEVSVACRDHPRVRNDGNTKFKVRAEVARRLAVADSVLGPVSLVVVEGHRSTAVQERFWNHRYAEVKEAHPDWIAAEISEETARFVAPPTGHPPHSTGGAVDVILVDPSGVEIDMGSALNGRFGIQGVLVVVSRSQFGRPA